MIGYRRGGCHGTPNGSEGHITGYPNLVTRLIKRAIILPTQEHLSFWRSNTTVRSNISIGTKGIVVIIRRQGASATIQTISNR